jgi:predicted transposase YdaD
MFLLDDIKQSRLYQDLRQEAQQDLLMRQLSKRFGKLSDLHTSKISELEITQLEELALDWLDFANIADLDRWLANLT